MKKNKQGQVWVEAVLYTLIGLTLMAVVLAYATPKINEYRDRILIEQSIASMQTFAEKIDEVSRNGVGTRLIVPSFLLKKGTFILNVSANPDEIVLRLDNLDLLYSEPGREIPFGNVYLQTIEGQKVHTTIIKIKMTQVLSGSDEDYPPAATPYTFSIEKKKVGANTEIAISQL